MNTYSGGGGALQLLVPYGPSQGGIGMQMRFGNYDVSSGNSWTAFKTILASDNYSGYSAFSGAITGASLVCTGNVTAYSDERLKTDWAALPDNFVDRLATVKSGTYTRTDLNERQAGSSAQDWQKLLPEVIQEGEYLSLAYGNAALVSAVQLAKRVVEQDERIAKLEALEALVAKLLEK
jgi:hypothetical protein